MQPEFGGWAFNRKRGEDIRQHWDKIPVYTDVLITHGPPYGILDECFDGAHVGCRDLLKRLDKINPKLHVYGHIHEAYGSKIVEGTTFVNASMICEGEAVLNAPFYADLENGMIANIR